VCVSPVEIGSWEWGLFTVIEAEDWCGIVGGFFGGRYAGSIFRAGRYAAVYSGIRS
jgi:hypothetical protein